jgi:hypothetical protein
MWRWILSEGLLAGGQPAERLGETEGSVKSTAMGFLDAAGAVLVNDGEERRLDHQVRGGTYLLITETLELG